MKRVSFHPSVRRELTEAALFYDECEAGLGGSFLDEVTAALEEVLAAPEAAPCVRGNVRRKLLRRFPYSLLYRLTAQEVRVLAVMHQKRRPDSWAGRT